MRDTFLFLCTVTGLAVWSLLGLFLLAFVVLAVIPAIWREMCFVGYSAMADKAEKAEARALGKRNAAAEASLSTPEPETVKPCDLDGGVK